MTQFRIKKGQPYPLGATLKSSGVNFSMVNSSQEECGLILYHKKSEQIQKIPFEKNHRIGNISCFFVEGLSIEEYEYNFYISDESIVDPYAKYIIGNEVWRQAQDKPISLRGGFYQSQFDWQKTRPLHIPYHESILYCLHVRSFTMHSSSKVKHKGTFEGLIEKIPYLKELGITAVELMPAYEFEECEQEKDQQTIEYQIKHYDEPLPNKGEEKADTKLNYWGYKEAYYFAPKASYSASGNPINSFKSMVREFHKNGMEVIMQFYFPNHIKQGYILEILKHWVLEYRIDGIHLKGNRLPVTLLATEPLFANTKIMCEDFSLADIYPEQESPIYKNLGYYRDEFMYDMRKFLKGDADMLKGFQYHMRNHNPKCGVINYITNYYGFTLNDLVSYDRKHNETNGEHNQDGTDYNYSWNCGIEGPTRKKAIVKLRRKQMKNAISFLMTAQGTPLLLSGDEFGNSQNGNNNCYCIDNETSWLDWRLVKRNQEFFEFVKSMIQFRKSHPILHTQEELTMTDRLGYGCPDLSYHGEEAWKVDLSNYNRHIAMMYCGRYARKDNKSEDDMIYIAYNMHWESHQFALPSLQGGYRWEVVNDTDSPEDEMTIVNQVEVKPRSVKILIGRKMKRVRRMAGKK